MTRLGYTMAEMQGMYFGEIWDKFEIYKVLFNREKAQFYQTEPEKLDSLRDL